MKKLSILLFFLFFYTTSFSQVLEFADFETLAKENQDQENIEESFGFSEKIPSSFSLEKYALVSNQGASSSCVGFAVARGAMSIVYNMLNGLSHDEKIVNLFDPFFIYASLRNAKDKECGKSGCECGTRIKHALSLVRDYGCKKQYVGPDLKCSSQLYTSDLRALNHKSRPYQIDDFVNLIEYYETRTGEMEINVNVKKIKQAIYNRNPVIAGMHITDDFFDVKKTNQPYSSRKNKSGAHAVTIVGYDDSKYGGSFRVLNSYGYDWGDKGYFWITYKEFRERTKVAYIMYNEDWSSWKEKNEISGSKYYRGFNTKGTMHWEGEVDSNRKFHGSGILVANNFCAVGFYQNGVPDGWWIHLSNRRINRDGFRGKILYNKGEVVDKESWGFSAEKKGSWEDKKDALHLETIDLNLSDELGEEDDIYSKDLIDIKNGY